MSALSKPAGWARVEDDTFRERVLAWFDDAETISVDEAMSLGTDRNAVVKTLRIMTRASPRHPQQLYIKAWVRDSFGGVRRYIRPIYARCYEPTPNKPRPRREPKAVASKRWRDRTAKRVNSVFDFANRFTQT